jgi:DNA-binding response OmpR family regulator
MARILLIDDDVESCEPLIAIFERAGHTVKHVPQARGGLSALPVVLPDLVIVDLRMPHMDGFMFLRQLREMPAGSHMPVILMTGFADVDTRWKASEMGVDHVFLKGDYDVKRLLNAIDEVTAGYEPLPSIQQHMIPTL